MSDSLLNRRHRREPMELQLTAMIDIFSMIVIFLIFGTVFGAADVILPNDMRLPASVSKESVESAPRVVIGRDQVESSLSGDKFPLEQFRAPDRAARPELAPLAARIREYVQNIPAEKRASGTLLSVIADRDAPYRDIYDVVSYFREAGLTTILFVATGDSKGNIGALGAPGGSSSGGSP